MTRETKVGLVVAGSFVALLGVVIASKMRGGGETPSEPVAQTVTPGGEESESREKPKEEGKGAAPKPLPDELRKASATDVPPPVAPPVLPPPPALDLNPRVDAPKVDFSSISDEDQKKKLDAIAKAAEVPPPPLEFPGFPKTDLPPGLPPPVAPPPGTPKDSVLAGKDVPMTPKKDETPLPPPVRFEDAPPVAPPVAPAPVVPPPVAAKKDELPLPPPVFPKETAKETPPPLVPPVIPPPAAPSKDLVPPPFVPGKEVAPPPMAPFPITKKDDPLPPPIPPVDPRLIEKKGPVAIAPPLEDKDRPPLGFKGPDVRPPVGIAPPVTPKGTLPRVTSVDIPPYVLRAEDKDFATLSQKFYDTDRYAQALLAFNREHPLAKDEIRSTPPRLVAGQIIYMAPRELLDAKYAALIPEARPVMGAKAPDLPPVKIGLAPPLDPVEKKTPGVPVSIGTPPIGTPPPGTPPPLTPPGATGTRSEMTKRLVLSGEQHILQLAQQTLGDSRRWPEIYRLNPSLQPANPIPAGTEVRLPMDARVP